MPILPPRITKHLIKPYIPAIRLRPIYVLTLTILIVACSCNSTKQQPQKERFTNIDVWDFLFVHECLKISPAYRDYKKRIKNRPTYIAEEKSPEYIILAIGENMPTHFTTGLRLKITSDGKVYKHDICGEGDQEWVLDSCLEKTRKSKTANNKSDPQPPNNNEMPTPNVYY